MGLSCRAACISGFPQESDCLWCLCGGRAIALCHLRCLVLEPLEGRCQVITADALRSFPSSLALAPLLSVQEGGGRGGAELELGAGKEGSQVPRTREPSWLHPFPADVRPRNRPTRSGTGTGVFAGTE